MITTELKQRIIEAIIRDFANFGGSEAKHAISLGIDKSQYSRVVKRGETEKVLSNENWITIARKLDVKFANDTPWNLAETPVYQFINTQLEYCQTKSDSRMICDFSNIGKTFTARYYARTHKNAKYVDCSQVKTKQKLIRKIASEFGVGKNGKYADVYEDLVFYLKALPTPLIILDEAGDLQYDAFLEIKALYNATEKACGYFLMGADGLEEKIRRSMNNKKNGFQEMFTRFGSIYGKPVPPGDEGKKVLQLSALMIIKANAADGVDINKVLRGTLGEDGIPSLRRIYTELAKRETV